MYSFYEFRAYNSQIIYGYGTERDADLYEDFLNIGREINHYGKSAVSKYRAKELRLDDRDDIVDLDDASDLLDAAIDREDMDA
jgi:hypothetical protein